MTNSGIGIVTLGDLPVRRLVRLARIAERERLSTLWITDEPFFRGAVPSAVACAAQTSRLRIGLGVVNPFAVARGAFPQVQFGSALLEADLMRHGTDELVARPPDLELAGMEWANVYIGLRGFRNPHEIDGIAPARLAVHRQAVGVVSAARTESTRWALVRVPGEALAQHATLPEDELWRIFFDAALRDWKAEGERLRRLADVFESAEKVHIVGDSTDLTFSTRGRRYLAGDGTNNMPDGEIYTAPIDESAEGRIAFEVPSWYGGVHIEGIRLEFERGALVAAKANSGEEMLREAIAVDPGARKIGEFGIGTNDGITRYTGDILYDEKIGGTIHIALGRAYPECGGPINRRSTGIW